MAVGRTTRLLAGACLLYLVSADLILLPSNNLEQVSRTKRQVAPNLNVHEIPKTSFSCQDKKLGEYYADPETRCQVYHICLASGNGRLSPMSFVCPNGTIFSQASRVCNTWERVYCQIAEQFYETLHGDLNIHRQDYGNPNDYVNLRLPNVPKVPPPNNIDNDNDDDYYDEPAQRTTTTTQAPRRNRPSNNNRNTRPPPRPTSTQPPPPPPPPPPSPVAPQGFRRQFVRPPPTVFTTPEPEDTTTEQPSRPIVVRRPVFRNQAFRPNIPPVEVPDEEPSTPPAPPARSFASGARVRGVIRPTPPPEPEDNPTSPPPPPRPALVLRQPIPAVTAGPAPGAPQIGIVLRGRQPALPVDRLPPGLRGIARPVGFPEIVESTVPPTELPGRSPVVRPGIFRPVGIQRPTSPAPTTILPTTIPTTVPQDETTAGTQAYEYDYVYDYDFNPQQQGAAAARSKRDVSIKEYRVSRYPPVVDTSRTPVLTNFTCQGKLSGFVYADVQTDCEMFHVCVPVSKGKMVDYRLFCANNTAFNQRLGICEEKENFKCSFSEKFYRHDKMGRHFSGQKPVYDKVYRLPRQVEKNLKEERSYPKTSFSCAGKTVGGYYADPDTDCQMFHICAPGLASGATDLKFLCSNGTAFNQKTLVCDQEGQVQCGQSEQYYVNNYTYFLEQEKRRVEEEKVPIENYNIEIYRKEKTDKVKDN